MTNLKKLESIALNTAKAVVDVRSWSGNLSIALHKKKQTNLIALHDEAQKIEDFARDLKRTIAIRYLWASGVDFDPLIGDDNVAKAYYQMRNVEYKAKGVI